jgi:hypothetical protein
MLLHVFQKKWFRCLLCDQKLIFLVSVLICPILYVTSHKLHGHIYKCKHLIDIQIVARKEKKKNNIAMVQVRSCVVDSSLLSKSLVNKFSFFKEPISAFSLWRSFQRREGQVAPTLNLIQEVENSS